MDKIHLRTGSGMARVVPARSGAVRDWQRWAPYAAVAWSLVYATLGVYWALSGRGFPYTSRLVDSTTGPVAGRFGPSVAWIVVLIAGIPSAAMGTAMLRGVRSRALRPLLISAGTLLAGVLLLLMIEFNLLIQVAYIPFLVFNLLTGNELGQVFLEGLAQSKWTIAHQLLCLNGGFLWLDDFWGDAEWNSMAQELKKVLPDRDFVELPLTHPLYHCDFDIKSKDRVPNVENGSRQQFDPNYPTWEKGGQEVHHRAIFDDKGRLMIFATHNTDNGDGWEWEGINHYYFEHFSEKTAYPLAINVIFYTMTH